MESYMPAGKTRYPRQTQTAVSYQHLDRDFITASRQEAASRRLRHPARANTLPKIATGRSIRSAKQLWEDYECIEVRSREQTESEKRPEVPPLRAPKNPRGLCKQPVKPVKPFHILHGPSDYGEAKHRLRDLYAQVTYLTNAVRNCDGSASYKGMCKRQCSYHRDDGTPVRLHWPSSDDAVPIPRLLLPVMPGTNTKWYAWKVDAPREVSPRGRGAPLGRKNGKRVAASAPVSRSLDFLERYSKNASPVAFTVEDTESRWSKTSGDADTKSRDGHPSVRTVAGTEVTASPTPSSPSSIVKHNGRKLKLKEHEMITGTAIFLTQSEPRVMPSAQEVHTDVADVSCHGDKEGTGKETNAERSTPHDVAEGKDGVPDVDRKQSPEDEMDIVARANVASTEQPKSVARDELQASTQNAALVGRELRQDTNLNEQMAMGTVHESDTGSENGHEPDQSGNVTRDEMSHSQENAIVTSNRDGSEEPGNTEEVGKEIHDEGEVPGERAAERLDNADSGDMPQDDDSCCAVQEDNEQTENNSDDASKKMPIKEKYED